MVNQDVPQEQSPPISVRFLVAVVSSMDYYIKERKRFRSRGELINYAVQRYLEALDEAERSHLDVYQMERDNQS